jgi:hypothetical protein
MPKPPSPFGSAPLVDAEHIAAFLGCFPGAEGGPTTTVYRVAPAGSAGSSSSTSGP